VETKVERSGGNRWTRECREWTQHLTRFLKERILVGAAGHTVRRRRRSRWERGDERSKEGYRENKMKEEDRRRR